MYNLGKKCKTVLFLKNLNTLSMCSICFEILFFFKSFYSAHVWSIENLQKHICHVHSSVNLIRKRPDCKAFEASEERGTKNSKMTHTCKNTKKTLSRHAYHIIKSLCIKIIWFSNRFQSFMAGLNWARVGKAVFAYLLKNAFFTDN